MVIVGTAFPSAPMAEAVGAEVDWAQTGQKITIMGYKTIELTVNSTIAKINGTPVTLDNPTVINGGRTMVPLRFVGEALGVKVSYTSLIKPKPVSLEIRNNNELWVEYSDGNKELLVNNIEEEYMGNP